MISAISSGMLKKMVLFAVGMAMTNGKFARYDPGLRHASYQKAVSEVVI